MVLNQLKQIRDELKSSADTYDTAFKNTALIAASELAKQTKPDQSKILGNEQHNKLNLNPVLDQEYFIAKYGSLKNAKTAYQEMYGKQKYGRSWSDFIDKAKKLDAKKLDVTLAESKTLTLEERITKIENLLISLGHQL